MTCPDYLLIGVVGGLCLSAFLWWYSTLKVWQAALLSAAGIFAAFWFMGD